MAGDYGLTQFEFDEERDLKSYPLWICCLHTVPIVTPLYAWSWCDGCTHGMQYSAEVLSVPTTKGWDWRIVNGYPYLTSVLLTSEEQKPREPIFRENLKPYIEDFNQEWGKLVSEMMALYKPLKEAELDKLSNIQLLFYFEEYLRVNKRQWDIHFYVFYAVYCIYSLFEEMCKELFGLSAQDRGFKRLMSGFDNMLFKVNRELWGLGDSARKLGVDHIFLSRSEELVLHELGETEAGRKWLEEYSSFLRIHGWRSERMLDWASPSWIEKPSLGIPYIKQYIKGGPFTLDEERKKLSEERQQMEEELLRKVPADQRSWFEKLMRVAQQCAQWSEEHNYYLDMMANALGRHVIKEYGRRFFKAGVIDQPDDVYFLMPWEIAKAAVVMERVNLRRYVKSRKEEYERYSKIKPEVFLGDPSKISELAEKDTLIRIQASMPIVRPELKADLYGAGSAPGVVEGVARVVMSEEELGKVAPGEILVAPITMAPWTVIFGIIKGVVTDRGGSLAHPVIVAREYGIPAVVGTLEATSKIKTGQRIRVDGDNAAVYILG